MTASLLRPTQGLDRYVPKKPDFKCSASVGCFHQKRRACSVLISNTMSSGQCLHILEGPLHCLGGSYPDSFGRFICKCIQANSRSADFASTQPSPQPKQDQGSTTPNPRGDTRIGRSRSSSVLCNLSPGLLRSRAGKSSGQLAYAKCSVGQGERDKSCVKFSPDSSL